MASVHDSIPHTVRTANDPRQTGLYNATLSHIDQVNSKIRLLRLSLPRDGPALRHLPGQWLDVHIPTITQAGGFTITSPPSTCQPPPSFSSSSSSSSSSSPYLELAIQRSQNPPALFFHQSAPRILQTPLEVRVGGSFVHPPADLSYAECAALDRLVFVAGGVGVNPIMSMVSAMHGLGLGKVGGVTRQVRILYGTKVEEGDDVLFYDRLRKIAEHWEGNGEVDFRFALFETGTGSEKYEGLAGADSAVKHARRRITHADIFEAIGPEDDRANTAVYICGPPQMTDEFVALLQQVPGMESKRVMCEKWW